MTNDIPDTTAPGARGWLLIVEDNVINQLVAVEMVRRLGYSCDVVASGAEALDALVERTYSAVLMDCYMPVMDGFAATEELRRREGEVHHTPVIAVTAGVMEENRERCFASGMDDYLTKPVRLETLGTVLDRWVRDNECRSEQPGCG